MPGFPKKSRHTPHGHIFDNDLVCINCGLKHPFLISNYASVPPDSWIECDNGEDLAQPTKTWKDAERKIARYLGFERRGADFGGVRGGKNDVKDHPWLSIEIKHGKRINYQLIVNAVAQAEAAAESNQTPVAITHREGDLYKDSVVCIRLETFRQWFGGLTSPPDIDSE